MRKRPFVPAVSFLLLLAPSCLTSAYAVAAPTIAVVATAAAAAAATVVLVAASAAAVLAFCAAALVYPAYMYVTA